MHRNVFKRLSATAILALAFGAAGPAGAASWTGTINGRPAYIFDTSQPIRAALVNNMSYELPNGDREMLTMARHYNLMLVDVPLDYGAPDASAQRVLDVLAAGAKAFPDHPEIKNLNVILIGFSARSAGAAITASSRLLSNPDATQAPQRVLAVATFDELDAPPFLPPPQVPHLFLSDPGDFYGGLLTNVEGLKPAISHHEFARSLAAQGRPITVVSQPGDWHGGSTYGWNHKITSRFMRFWMEDILSRSLPSAPPMAGPALAPDWRTYAPAWRGTYDVSTNTNFAPWARDERMTNVVIAPQAAASRDSRPYIWLPSQKIANIWKAYAETGSMPPEYPQLPLQPLVAFARPGSDATSRAYDDTALTATVAPVTATATYTSVCAFSPSGDSNLIVNFDRAVTSASATVSGGILAGPVRTWSNVVIVPLKRTVFTPLLNIQLTGITPADGGAPIDMTIAAKYVPPCP